MASTRWQNASAKRYEAWEYARDLGAYTMLKRMYSRRPLLETMVDFWSDHFHIKATGDLAWPWAREHSASDSDDTALLAAVGSPSGSGEAAPLGANADQLSPVEAGSASLADVEAVEAAGVDVAVDLGGRERGVAEQLLDRAQVGAALEQVRRERVAERMGADIAAQTGALSGIGHATSHHACAAEDRRNILIGRARCAGGCWRGHRRGKIL